ncbi:MAG: nitrilase-related carbon-nitrogen hydrolase, partial [Candidatus Zixiibacteriota bacterium]
PGLAQRAVPIHALMNRVYVITTNRYGTEGDLTFTGLSLIADPGGNVLAESPAVGDDVKIVDIDVQLARDKQVTARNDILADRRPEEYRLLAES